MKYLKMNFVMLVGLLLSLPAQAQRVPVNESPKSVEGVLLFKILEESGREFPGIQSFLIFDQSTRVQTHHWAMLEVLLNGFIDLRDFAQRDLFFRVIAPATETILAGERLSQREATILGIDSEHLVHRERAARKIIAAIGHIEEREGRGETQGRCGFSVTWSGSDGDVRASATDVVSGFGDDFVPWSDAGGDVSVPLGLCVANNDKCCEASDDALENATCETSTDDNCKLTTRNGVKLCRAADSKC